MRSREQRRADFERRELVRKAKYEERMEAIRQRSAALDAAAAERKTERQARGAVTGTKKASPKQPRPKAKGPLAQMHDSISNLKAWNAYDAQQRKIALGAIIPKDKLLPKPPMPAEGADTFSW